MRKASYLSTHWRNGSLPQFERWITKPLQALWGGNKHREALKDVSASEVPAKLRECGVRLDKTLAALERLPAEDKEVIIAAGGWKAVRGRLPELETRVARHLTSTLTPQHALDIVDRGWIADPVERTNAEAFQRAVLTKVMQQEQAEQAELEALRPIVLKAEPSSEYSFDGLFAHWAKGGAKKPRHYQATAKLLRECYGNVDYRTLNPATKDGWRFADWLSEKEVGPASQENHIGRARAMYKAAARYLSAGNPFADVKPVDVYLERDRGKFSYEQLRALLRVVEAERFGDTRQHKRYLEVLWLLRLAIYTGARINEIASLRKEDVRPYRGVGGAAKFQWLYFRPEIVKAQKGEDKSRETPLHPDISDEFMKFVATIKGEHIFGAFENSKDNGRAAWLVSNLPAFMRKHATAMGIELNGEELVDHRGRPLKQHCLRHTYHKAITDARLSGDAQRILVGRRGKDVHESVYATDMGLELLYEDVCKVKPLG
jgi:integrase